MMKINKIQMIACFLPWISRQHGSFVSDNMSAMTDSFDTLTPAPHAADAAYRRKPAVRGAR
jgi:hypothetical protein